MLWNDTLDDQRQLVEIVDFEELSILELGCEENICVFFDIRSVNNRISDHEAVVFCFQPPWLSVILSTWS